MASHMVLDERKGIAHGLGCGLTFAEMAGMLSSRPRRQRPGVLQPEDGRVLQAGPEAQPDEARAPHIKTKPPFEGLEPLPVIAHVTASTKAVRGAGALCQIPAQNRRAKCRGTGAIPASTAGGGRRRRAGPRRRAPREASPGKAPRPGTPPATRRRGTAAPG